MKLKLFLLLTTLFYGFGSNAQNHLTSIQIGGSYYFPAYTSTFGENRTNGLGAEFC